MLIVGCGYVGRRLAESLQADGAAVTAVVRTQASADRLAAAGLDALACDLDTQALPPGRTAGQRLFYLAPPPAEGMSRCVTRVRRRRR